MSELHDAVLTYIQVTGADITEETKEIAEMTDADVIGCKRFHEMYVRNNVAKLYVWSRFCIGDEDYGLAFAIAESEEEAKKLVTKDGEYVVWQWGDLEVRELSKCGYFAYGG